MLPWKQVGDQRPRKVVGIAGRKKWLHPSFKACVPFKIRETPNESQRLKFFISGPFQTRVPDNRRLCRLWRTISDSNRNCDGRSDRKYIFCLSGAELIAFQVNNPKLI